MNEEVKGIYKEAFYQFLTNKLNLNSFDSKIEGVNLYFSPSNDINSNIQSKYFSVLNDFYFDSFSNEDLETLKIKKEIDDELLKIVERTYKKAIKKGNVDGIMYDPPLPENYVKNGSLVLEFVYGKNTKKVADDEYVKLYKAQKTFIEAMIKEIKTYVLEKLEINCEIFINKRVKYNA